MVITIHSSVYACLETGHTHRIVTGSFPRNKNPEIKLMYTLFRDGLKVFFVLLLREHPLFCALFTIQTTFRFILAHPPTIQFEHRGQINVHTLKDAFVFTIQVHVS